MNFSEALEYLKQGHKLARSSWNPKGTFIKGNETYIYLVNGTRVNYENLRNEIAEHLQAHSDKNAGKRATINSHIDLKQADDSIAIGWTPSQADMLSDDWEVIYRQA